VNALSRHSNLCRVLHPQKTKMVYCKDANRQGLALRGVPDERREGSRRPSFAAVVQEALGIDLPKTSQLSPWWRDHLIPDAARRNDGRWFTCVEQKLTPKSQ